MRWAEVLSVLHCFLSVCVWLHCLSQIRWYFSHSSFFQNTIKWLFWEIRKKISLFQRGLLSLVHIFLYLFKSRSIVCSNETRHFLSPVKDHGEPEAPLFMVCDKINSKAMKESLLTWVTLAAVGGITVLSGHLASHRPGASESYSSPPDQQCWRFSSMIYYSFPAYCLNHRAYSSSYSNVWLISHWLDEKAGKAYRLWCKLIHYHMVLIVHCHVVLRSS